MWSLPSRSLATASASLVAVLLVASTSERRVGAQTDCVSDAARQGVSQGIHTPARVNLIANGDFSDGLSCWYQFATPDPTYVVAEVTNSGVMNFYRVPQPEGERSNQAVVFQWTRTPLWDFSPLQAIFDLGNSSDVRKRVSVLIHESDFSDLRVCTFWLAPHSPRRTYRMQTHTSRVWYNTAISFYAASAGDLGGFYQVDNVSMTYEPALPADRTLCDDPTAPNATSQPDGPNLIRNGDFSAGMAPWGVFHGLQYQIANGTFEFVWVPAPPPAQGTLPTFPRFEPAPVVIQRTGAPMAAGEILTAQVDIGNSSNVRKRVSLLIHEWDFDDLAACTFWLEPGTPMRTYTMRMFTTEAWTDAAFSVYAATKGPETWIQIDNAVLRRTPNAELGGKECYEPGAFQPTSPAPEGRTARVASGASILGGWTSSVRARARSAAPAPSAPVGSGIVQPAALRYFVPPSDDTLRVEVSEDGNTWETLHAVEPSENWRVMTLDLSGVTGRVMFVRVVK